MITLFLAFLAIVLLMLGSFGYAKTADIITGVIQTAGILVIAVPFVVK